MKSEKTTNLLDNTPWLTRCIRDLRFYCDMNCVANFDMHKTGLIQNYFPKKIRSKLLKSLLVPFAVELCGSNLSKKR